MTNSEAALKIDVLSFLGFLKVFFFPLCSPACPGTLSVYQAGLKTQRSACLCLTGGRIKGMCHHAPLWIY